jgi:hypothetical protein
MLRQMFARIALGIGLAAASLASPTVAAVKSRNAAPVFPLKDATGVAAGKSEWKSRLRRWSCE